MRTLRTEPAAIFRRVPHRIIRATEAAEEILLDPGASMDARQQAAAFLRQERERFVSQEPSPASGAPRAEDAAACPPIA